MDPNKAKETIGKYVLADGMKPIMDMEKSHGSYIVDARDGKQYLDMFSMFASGAIGYNHPRLIENQALLGKVALHKPTLSDVYNVYYADFIETFSKIAMPDYLQHAFFIEGGALAVENALKVSFDWKVKKNLMAGKGEKGSMVIHFKQAFHGRSGYTMSLTNTDPRKIKYFPKFDWPRIDNPKIVFPLHAENLADVEKREAEALKQIKAAFKNNPDEIACLIIEPIQGEGGDNHFRDEFFVKAKALCDENEALFIFDEVQTGLGITGKMWAHQHFSVKPDIMSFGKKSQVCGILAGEKIFEVPDNVFVESSRINSTFGGNLTDMMRFKIILQVMREENLVENAANIGNYLLGELITLSNAYPKMLSNPRGKGLYAAIDVHSGAARDELVTRLREHKLLILGCGEKSIRFRPHLTTNNHEIDEAMSIFKKCLG